VRGPRKRFGKSSRRANGDFDRDRSTRGFLAMVILFLLDLPLPSAMQLV